MKRWLILAEGKSAGQFEPLDLTRPCYGIRDGAYTNAERWIALLRPSAVTFEARDMLVPLVRESMASTALDSAGAKPDEIWTIEGMVQPLPDSIWSKGAIADFTWTASGCRVTKVSAKATSAALAPRALPFRALEGVWDLIGHLPEQLAFDFSLWKRLRTSATRKLHAPSKGVNVVGDPKLVWIGKGVQIYPHNVFNTEYGPIILDDNVTLEPFNRIDGPAYIGQGTSLLGGKFTNGTAIGPGCKIGGEWEASIAQGFVNKAHAGFFGHGILGEWVNLGAMTTNSDLKNNYGTVRVSRAGVEVDTGRIKVGSFIADHSKTGIGTLIPTGANWGVGANYYGGDLGPKYLPCFAWGDKGHLVEHRLDKMLSTADAAMKRRSETLRSLGRHDHMTDSQRAVLAALFAATAKERSAQFRQHAD